IDNLKNTLSKNDTCWLIVNHLNSAEPLVQISRVIEMHPLLQEDILNTEHLPKFEEFDNLLFITLKIFDFDQEALSLNIEQVSLLLGENFVVTFRESGNDFFNPLFDRIQNSIGKIRTRKSDYLFYAILDFIVDNYYLALEKLETMIGEVEADLMDQTTDAEYNIPGIRKTLIPLRRIIFPLREELKKIMLSDNKLINKGMRPYLSDVQDHLQHLSETTDSFTEMVANLVNLQVTNQNNKMNNIMMNLTIVATIFIPLSFLAGIYGMNFKYMPELDWKYGYPAFLMLVLFIASGMLWYMKKKKWF
ncbi:MAG TPA: magnesium/cobalt transporter CorA, partial [Bacteroidales bacterium]|nr:magnesium/cobalt transporter CorA [Bacteroidales bacterium]